MSSFSEEPNEMIESKKTLCDIGIGINSMMEVMIPKYTILPHEFDCHLVMNDMSLISLYEGNRFYVKDNTNIGNYNIYSKGNILFQLKIDMNYVLSVYIDEKKMDTIQCFQWMEFIDSVKDENEKNELMNIIVAEEELRKLIQAKNEYMEYIESSLSSLNELTMETSTKDFLIDRLNWAKQVLDVEDVTYNEYILALGEIESIVNPILMQFLNKPY